MIMAVFIDFIYGMTAMPTLRQLEYLTALADHRHFGRAAQAAAISQPTLSHQLQALEKRLGVPLVERHSKGIELTPIGREIADRARSVLVEVKDMRDLARRAGDRLAGTIRFGASPTLGPYLMPPVIADLHRSEPDLRLYMREGIPDDLALELVRGSIDMLLGPLPIEGETLRVEPIFREPLLLVASPDHPLAVKRKARIGDLEGHGVLSLDRQHHLHRDADRICREHGMTLLHDYEGTSLDSIRQMVASGLGLGILPQLYVMSEIGHGDDVAILDIDGWDGGRGIGVAWRRSAGFADSYAAIGENIRNAATQLLKGSQ